eukprot:bmy_05670T0
MASVDPLQDREGFMWKDRGWLILRLGRCPGFRLPAHVLVQCCHPVPSLPSRSTPSAACGFWHKSWLWPL